MKNIKKGFTLIELMIVLGLIAVSTTGIILVSKNVQSKNQIASEIQQVKNIAQGLSNAYSNSTGYDSSLSVTTALNNGAITSAMAPAGVLNDSWGNPVTLTPDSWYGVADQLATVHLSQVPKDACVMLGSQLYNDADKLTISGTTIKDTSSTTPSTLNIGALSTDCGQYSDMTFGFAKLGQAPSAIPSLGSNNSLPPPAGLAPLTPLAPLTSPGVAQVTALTPSPVVLTTPVSTTAPIATSPTAPVVTTASSPTGSGYYSSAPGIGQPCVTPAPNTKTVLQSPGCTGGWIGIRTVNENYTQTGSCISGAVVWGPWVDQGTYTVVTNTCAACPAPVASTVQQSPGCTGGWVGQRIIDENYLSTANCSSGSVVWGTPVDQGTYTVVSNTCTAPTSTCVAPSPTTATQTLACQSGYTGSITQTQTTTYSCPSSTGAPVASTGGWVTTSDTCTQTTGVWGSALYYCYDTIYSSGGVGEVYGCSDGVNRPPSSWPAGSSNYNSSLLCDQQQMSNNYFNGTPLTCQTSVSSPSLPSSCTIGSVFYVSNASVSADPGQSGMPYDFGIDTTSMFYKYVCH